MEISKSHGEKEKHHNHGGKEKHHHHHLSKKNPFTLEQVI
jgi:hypothetical protein